MKKRLLSTFLLSFLLIPIMSTGVCAESVYIPDSAMRNQIISQIENENTDLTIKGELPSIEDMLKLKNELYTNTDRSLEGIQYASKVTKLTNNSPNVIDYRPISSLKNLKTYDTYNSLNWEEDGKNIIDLKPFSTLTNIEKLYLGYANVIDLTPLENLTNLQSYFSTGYDINLPTTYISKDSKKFIIEQPVKYSTQFTERSATATSNTSDDLSVELKNDALIIDNLDLNTAEIRLTLEGSSKTFDWDKGFKSTQDFIVPISWY